MKLGDRCKDLVTGFTGIVTARVEYITGCAQFCLSPPVNDKGEVVDSRYFDEHRLKLLDAGAVQIGQPDAMAEPPRRLGSDPYSTPPAR